MAIEVMLLFLCNKLCIKKVVSLKPNCDMIRDIYEKAIKEGDENSDNNKTRYCRTVG